MAMPRRIKIEFGEAFPFGLLAVGEAEEMRDFDAKPDRNGNRPQAIDEETELPMWTLDVLDADPEVSKSARSFAVRIASRYCPALPALPAGTPAHLAFMRPIELEGLTATPYVADSPMGNGRGRLAWSFRATGIKATSTTAADPQSGKNAKEAAA